MLKKSIVVIILLSLCITISVGSYFLIEKISEDLLSDLTTFLMYAENGEEDLATISIKKCSEKLEDYEKIYAVFLNHNLFEDLMISIPSVLYLYKSNNSDEAMEKCLESVETLKILVHEQKICFENIL